MISWISGELIESWQTNQKFFVLINCQGLGYEIQILEYFYKNLKKNQISNKPITLWIKHLKKEESDLLFGFKSKDEKNFFVEILNIRGIGSQIGMGILNKYSISEVIEAINTQNKQLISSVPGIGQKMTDRLILELKNKFKNELQIDEDISRDAFVIKNTEIKNILSDLELTLQSLNYKKNEIRNALSIVKEKNITNQIGEDIKFENLLKLAMNYLDKNSRNIVG